MRSAAPTRTCSATVARTAACSTVKPAAGRPTVESASACHAGMGLQIAPAIADRRESCARPICLHCMIGHHEALRMMVEHDGNTWVRRHTLGDSEVMDLMALHVRFGDARQGRRNRVAKLSRRLFHQLDRMKIVERNALERVLVFGADGESRRLRFTGSRSRTSRG